MNSIASNPSEIIAACTSSFAALAELPEQERIDAINEIKLALHAVSPMKDEPVDCVVWVKNEIVRGNPWNPNTVAPPEMKLLQHSIHEDGFTQPLVVYREDDGGNEVVDGFHRHRIGKECSDIRERVKGRLPVVVINEGRADRGDRMAATIRHNRARGKHQVDAMSDIVVDLKRRNWSDEKIAKELGMEPDEVLRLAQISGLAELFADREFSEAWDADRQTA